MEQTAAVEEAHVCQRKSSALPDMRVDHHLVGLPENDHHTTKDECKTRACELPVQLYSYSGMAEVPGHTIERCTATQVTFECKSEAKHVPEPKSTDGWQTVNRRLSRRLADG